MKDTEPKNEKFTGWAYFAPDGYVQVRSIAETMFLSRTYVCAREYNTDGKKTTYKDYEKKGYVQRKVNISIEVV